MTAHEVPSADSIERDARELFVGRTPFATSRITARIPLLGKPPRVESLIPLFHELIRTKALEVAPLIDVAHYGHVASGPGILLIAQDAHYSVDLIGNGGARYSKKRGGPQAPRDKLDDALRHVLKLALILEQRAGARFDTSRIEISIEDRLVAPNDLTTLDAVKVELQTWMGPLVGVMPELNATLDRRAPFSVELSGWAPVSVATLLQRVS